MRRINAMALGLALMSMGLFGCGLSLPTDMGDGQGGQGTQRGPGGQGGTGDQGGAPPQGDQGGQPPQGDQAGPGGQQGQPPQGGQQSQSGPGGQGGQQGMPQQPPSCESDADCGDACPEGAKGCTCAKGPQDGKICVPSCKSDADCPAPPQGDVSCDTKVGICVPKMDGAGGQMPQQP